MGWEQRHGRSYLYLYRRTEAGVVAEYYGRGPAASQAAAVHAGAARARREQAAALRAAKAALAAPDGHLDRLDALCRDLADGSLLAAGYHRPNYRSWRKRRDHEQGGNAVTEDNVERSAVPAGMTGAAYAALVAAARKGEPGAVARLRAVLSSEPGLWEQAGDLADAAERAWVGVIAGDDAVFAEALRRKTAAMRAGLAGPGASPMHSLLAARVAASWLQVLQAEAAYAQAGALTQGEAAFAEKRVDWAQRRHLAALAALASVQKMLPASSAAPAAPRLGPDGRVALGVVAGAASAEAGVRRAV